MKSIKTLLGTFTVIGATFASGCAGHRPYAPVVAPVVVVPTPTVAPAPVIAVPVRRWYHAPRFQGHHHHHHHHAGPHR